MYKCIHSQQIVLFVVALRCAVSEEKLIDRFGLARGMSQCSLALLPTITYT